MVGAVVVGRDGERLKYGDLIFPDGKSLGTRSTAPGGLLINDAMESTPLTKLQTRRVELVLLASRPSKSELEEPITLPQMSREDAVRRLTESVEIHYIDSPWRKNGTG